MGYRDLRGFDMSGALKGRRAPMTATKLIRWGAFLLAAVAIGEFVYVSLGANCFAVVPGQYYRCSQPTPGSLEATVRSLEIRTIVNLRGDNTGKDWYDAERTAANRIGVPMIDISLASNCPPTTRQFRQLIDVIDRAPRPILFHCQSGADRTGLASMMCQLVQPGRSLAEARRQISLRYGHKFWSEAARLHAIPEAYADWLTGRGDAHSPERFREWGLTVYCEEAIWTRLGLLPRAIATRNP